MWTPQWNQYESVKQNSVPLSHRRGNEQCQRPPCYIWKSVCLTGDSTIRPISSHRLLKVGPWNSYFSLKKIWLTLINFDNKPSEFGDVWSMPWKAGLRRGLLRLGLWIHSILLFCCFLRYTAPIPPIPKPYIRNLRSASKTLPTYINITAYIYIYSIHIYNYIYI